MLDPLAVEQEFQNLLHSLRLLSSPRIRISSIVAFLEPLVRSHNQSYFAAYRRELLPRLCEQIVKTDLGSTPVAFLNRASALLDAAAAGSAETANDPLVQEARLHLGSALERVGVWARGRQDRDSLHEVDESWGTDSAPNMAWVPLVEREPLITAQSGVFGLVRRLQVEVVLSHTAAASDAVYVNRRTDLAGLEHGVFRDSVQVAKALLERFAGIRLRKGIRVYCALDDPHLVGGRSLGPALAVLVFVELLKLHNHRMRFALSPRATITGELGPDGAVMPLQPATLAKKLEACFYSSLRIVAVPRGQEEEGRAILQRLAAEPFAPPPPVLVPIAGVEDVLLDRRITRAWRVPLSVHIVQKVWERRRIVAASLIAGLAAIVAWPLVAPMDRKPADAIYQSDEILVRNRFGEAIDNIPVAPTVTALVNRIGPGSNERFLALCDADADGRTDIVWSDMDAGTPGSFSRISCKTVGEDTLRWSYILRCSLTFLQNKDVHSDVFGVSAILARDVDADGNVEILVAGNHEMFFPSVLVKLDARTGREMSTYVHMGHLNGLACADIAGDGREEVIVYGTNNAFKRASVAVFDGRDISGSSPATSDYQLAPHPRGSELYYLVIPRTIVGEAFADKVPHNGVKWISNVGTGGLIRVHVMDVGYRLGEPDQVIAYVYAYFGRDMQFRGFSTGDDFDMLARTLTAQQIIKGLPDKAYFDALGGSLEYWDGTAWLREPVANRPSGNAAGGTL